MNDKQNLYQVKKCSEPSCSVPNKNKEVEFSKELSNLIESAFLHLNHIYKFTDYVDK